MDKIFRHKIKQILIFRISLFLLILVWVFGISFPFFFQTNEQNIILYQFLHKIYSGVCHQFEYKSISVNGTFFHVCSRCYGIYIGALLGSVLSLFYFKQKHLKIKYLYFASIPILIDVIYQSLNITDYIKISALSTGMIFGFAIVVYFISSIENYLTIQKTNYSINELK